MKTKAARSSPVPEGGPEDDASATLRKTAEPLEQATNAGFRLVVIEGQDVGKTLVLDMSVPSRSLVGQSEVCALRLSDRHASRRHAAFEIDGRRLRIQDVGSMNGTFVDGVAVRDAYCQDGAIVRIGETALRVERRDLENPPLLTGATRFSKVLGQSAAMRRLFPLCERIAASDVPVVIEGETGTGKELLAESIHAMGPRAAGPFVVFDCTAVPANLMEAELFGAERGAFTGAVSLRKGLFELAEGGTLFIDEIGDLDLALQPKLLRAIERREVRRIGGREVIRADVRILSATRRDLDREVQAGRFRDDLFHRIAVGRVELPPLRARRSDIGLLVQHFIEEMKGSHGAVSLGLLQKWREHTWPGNVRELRNAVAAQLALGDLARDLGGRREPKGRHPEDGGGAPSTKRRLFEEILAGNFELREARRRVVEELEREYVAHALEQHGSVAEAARAAGVEKRYFQLLRARLLRDEG